MAKKKVAAVVKIQIPAGQATPAPPVGTALGPHGVAIMDFCKAYNAETESQRGTIIPVEITIFEDRTFTFVTKTPPTPVLLRQAAGIEKGADTTGTEEVGTDHQCPVHRDRPDEDARSQRLRPRRRQAPGGRHRPLDGHQDPVVRRSSRQPLRPGAPRRERRRSDITRGSQGRTKTWQQASDTPTR